MTTNDDLPPWAQSDERHPEREDEWRKMQKACEWHEAKANDMVIANQYWRERALRQSGTAETADALLRRALEAEKAYDQLQAALGQLQAVHSRVANELHESRLQGALAVIDDLRAYTSTKRARVTWAVEAVARLDRK